MDRGMKCGYCGNSARVKILINCAGCFQVVCRSCYDMLHSDHAEIKDS